jgi:hypothetical protein
LIREDARYAGRVVSYSVHGPRRHPAAPSNLPRRVARYSAVLALEHAAAVARHLSDEAAAYGDWDRAAVAEEQAVVAEHQAALIRADSPADQLAARALVCG